MRKSFPIWIVFIFSIITVGSKINAIFSDRSRTHNLQITTLAQNIQLPKNTTFHNLLSGQKEKLEFTANDDRLGTIEFLFNNYQKVNEGQIVFRLKERGSTLWYYESSYDIAKIDSGEFYPFGFPLIENSKGKSFVVEIESLDGDLDDSVSLNQEVDYFQAKYSYPKAYLLQNKKDFPHFIFTKIDNYLGYFNATDLKSLYVLLILTFVIGIPIIMFTPVFQKPFKQTFYANRNIFFLLSIYAISHIPFLSFSQYWDSLWYWNLLIWGVGDFKATAFNLGEIVESLIENFNFLGHPSMGYAGVSSISQFIDMDNVTILNIENVILAMMAIWAFYKIVTYFFPKRQFENTLITAVFAFNPLFYATSISFNLDFGVLVFEVLMIESLIYKKYGWFFVWSTLLIFSKEIGILIYITLLLSYIFLYLFKKWWRGDRKVRFKRILAWVLPLAILGLYFNYTKGNVWNSTTFSNTGNTGSFEWNDSRIFSFGLSSGNITTRIFQQFIMNFGWIMSSVVLIVWARAQVFGKRMIKGFSNYKMDLIRIFIFLLAVFVLFNWIYIAMPFPRYVVAGVFFVILVFYFSLNSLLPKKMILRRIFLLGLLFFTIIQVFKAIDPSPRIIFGTNYLGKNPSSPIFGYHDGLVYNSQFVMVDKLANMIKNYSKGGPGIILDKGATYFFKDVSNVGNVEDIERLRKGGANRLIYVHIPWFTNKEESLKQIQKLYSIKSVKNLEYDGYYVEIYDLESIR